jgi:hypothetical protein
VFNSNSNRAPCFAIRRGTTYGEKYFIWRLRIPPHCIILIIALLFLIYTPRLFAGRDREYSDRFPKLSQIIQHHGKIYFAGTWPNHFIVAENKNNKWDVFTTSCPNGWSDYCDIYPVSDGIIFQTRNNYCSKFTFDNNNWEKIDCGSIHQLYNEKYSEENGKRYILKVQEGKKSLNYIFPLPSYQAFKRFRCFRMPDYDLEANIGASFKKDSVLFFNIDFYDAEGYSGIGGLGIFDYSRKKFGIIRHRLLVSNSCGLIANYGDTIVIATNYNGEYGIFSNQGLILIDLNNGRIVQLSNPPEEYYLAIQFIGNTLWISSNQNIQSWDLHTNTWRTYQADKYKVNKNYDIYRHPAQFADFSNGGLPTHKVYDSLITIKKLHKGDIISCYWPGEMKYSKGIKGWMSRTAYNQILESNNEQRAISYPGYIVYTDSTLQLPYHSFNGAQIRKLQETANTVKVIVYSAYIHMDNIKPIFSKVQEDKGSLTDLQWESLLSSRTNILEEALATLENEQDEIRNNAPVIDRNITIIDSIDLYDQVHDILYARWLPEDNRTYPQGIRLNDRTEIMAMNGKLEHKNKGISIGDTICSNGRLAQYKYIILGYTVDGIFGNRLKRLSFQYIVTMTPQRYD